MESHEPGHPDASTVPVLEGETRVRDVATGGEDTVDAWIARCMEREGRDRQACLEELMNAVARGDVTVAG